MHRRQYIPLSHHKVSRRALLADRQNLVKKIEAEKAEAAAAKKAAQSAREQTFTAKLRSFVGKAKRALTAPVFQRKSA